MYRNSIYYNLKDVQYIDIEYMIGYRDFTVDPKIYSGLAQFVDEKEKDGLKFVLILVSQITLFHDK